MGFAEGNKMPTKKLTKTWLKDATTENKKYQTDYWDTHKKSPPGFGVRVSPKGRKTFVVRYQVNGNGKRRCVKVGTFPATGLDVARQRARHIVSEAEAGRDYVKEEQEKREQEKRRKTVADFCDEYVEDHAKPHMKSWRDVERRLQRFKDAYGEKALADLSTSDVARLHKDIGKDHTREANCTVQTLRAALNKALTLDYLPPGSENVAAEALKNGNKFQESQRERFLEEDELPRVLEAIDNEPRLYVRAALKLILMAGLRKMEALTLEWRDVKWDHSRIVIRAEKAKNNKGRHVPLTDAAMQLLRELPRQEGTPYVFAGRYKGSHLGRSTLDRCWRRIRQEADVEDVTIHDLRRTCGSWLAMQGVGLPIIGKILGHSSLRATQLYARLQPNTGRPALERFNDMVASLQESES